MLDPAVLCLCLIILIHSAMVFSFMTIDLHNVEVAACAFSEKEKENASLFSPCNELHTFRY